MGKKTILERYQKRFLELVFKEPYILTHYYLTGGTVLSEFYLKHRESYDIDLFTEKEVHLPSIEKFVQTVARTLGAKELAHRRFLGLHTFFFKFPDGKELKVDFNYYPFPRINRAKNWRGLEIDSLEDIAVNKIHTISMRPRARDFVDIFFIFKKQDFSLPYLISLAKAKFDWHIDAIGLGEALAGAVAYKDLPRILLPFEKKEMDGFFLKLAKSLEKDIFK